MQLRNVRILYCVLVVFVVVVSPEVSPKPGALDNFPDNDGVQEDDRDVGNDLHEDHLAPELVVGRVVRVGHEGGLSDRRLVGVRPHVRLKLEKLTRETERNEKQTYLQHFSFKLGLAGNEFKHNMRVSRAVDCEIFY